MLIWTTEAMASPSGGGGSWYYPEHCVVIYGVEDDGVLISDSLAGLVVRDRSRFQSIYEAIGRPAMVVLPDA